MMGSVPQHRDFDSAPSMARAPLHPVEAAADFEWCVLCERTFRRGRHRLVGGQRLCPYAGCDGGLPVEPWEWTRVLAANPDYPPVPMEDVAYPFFGRPAPEPGDG